MATGIVRCALASVIEKTPPVSPHSKRSCTKLKGQELLDTASLGDAQRDAFDNFSREIVQCLTDKIATVAKKYKMNSSKRAKLWTEFHKMRLDKYSKPSLLWNELVKSLDTDIPDPLLHQFLLTEL